MSEALVLVLALLLTEPDPTVVEAREAIDAGVRFLLSSQNEDGSWGGVKNATYTSSFANVATYHCWQIGTTALATEALIALGGDPAEPAVERGLAYIVANARLRRPAEWDVDNNWGLIYGVNVLSIALRDPRFSRGDPEPLLRDAARTMLDGMKRHQSPRGGWGYYADPSAAWRPDWATSFTTAVGVLALVNAREAGLEVDAKMFDAAVRALESARLRNGAFDYEVNAVPRHFHLESINQVKGSLGRIQVGNLALIRAGRAVEEEQVAWGIDQFFRHHKFLDAARLKPIPHEAYYANAAYFYLFGHHYAARLIATQDHARRPEWERSLRREILKCREESGAMWDFYIASHTRPYGTAFGILALAETLPHRD